MKLLISLSFLVVAPIPKSTHFSSAMDASPHTFYERQPDGNLIALKQRGDEEEHWVSDLNEYTVIEDSDGYFVYAEETSDGLLEPTRERVGRADPKAKGLKKKAHERGPKNCFKKLCGGVTHPTPIEIDPPQPCAGRECEGRQRSEGRRHLLENDPGPEFHDRRMIEAKGVLNNLVIMMKFRDHNRRGRVLPSEQDIEILMNNDGPHPLCPTGSVRDVYKELSYGQLTIDSTVAPWYVTSRDESWYADGASGTTNLHEAIRETLDYLDDNSIINFDDFDQDGDGYIDAITILHSGYSAEWGGTDCEGTRSEDRIWSHKWKLWSDSSGKYRGPWVSKGGVQVWEYHISPALWDTCGSDIGRVGVIAHETGHFLGLMDLYDRDGGGRGLGGFDMMSSSWGFDGSQLYPGHMSAYSKLQLGWLEPRTPSLGLNFVFNLEERSDEPQIYKIGDGEYNFPSGEYLLIECRQKKGFDLILPRAGLAIYHIDERADLDTEGHPGQNGWPKNGNHYRVALLQADGYYNLERGDNRGGTRDFFHAGDVNSLSPSTGDPSNGPFPNTDSYQRGRLAKTNVHILDISQSGDVMSFFFTDGSVALTKEPSSSPSDNPTNIPSAKPSKSPSSFPSVFPSITSSSVPSSTPSSAPSIAPSNEPSITSSIAPSISSSNEPSISSSSAPSTTSSSAPSTTSSSAPSTTSSSAPSTTSSSAPSTTSSSAPSTTSSSTPSIISSSAPSTTSSSAPTQHQQLSQAPSQSPSVDTDETVVVGLKVKDDDLSGSSAAPSTRPLSSAPSSQPSSSLSSSPSTSPSFSKNTSTTMSPSSMPSSTSTQQPSSLPTVFSSDAPTGFVCQEKKRPCQNNDECCSNNCRRNFCR